MTAPQTAALFIAGGIAAAAHGVWWNRRLIRRLRLRHYREELRRELLIRAMAGKE